MTRFIAQPVLNGLPSYAVFRDQGAHIRLEEPEKTEPGDGTMGSSAQAAAKPAVALGLCLREITIGPDVRAREESGGGQPGGRWFGRNFRKMETAILGNYCECANLFVGGLVEGRCVNYPTIRWGGRHIVFLRKYDCLWPHRACGLP